MRYHRVAGSAAFLLRRTFLSVQDIILESNLHGLYKLAMQFQFVAAAALLDEIMLLNRTVENVFSFIALWVCIPSMNSLDRADVGTVGLGMGAF